MSLHNYTLTPSQEDVVNMCIKLFSCFKIIIIKGDLHTGKHVTAMEIFRRLNAIVEPFDLCELAKQLHRELSNQDLVQYLDSLLQRVTSRMSKNYNPALNSNEEDKIGIIYIRSYNMIADILTDCYSKLRFFLPLIFNSFSEKLPNNVKVLITTTGYCSMAEDIHWCVDLPTTREDMEFILKPFLINNKITEQEYEGIIKISKLVPIGKIIFSLKYAFTMCKDMKDREVKDFIETYNRALNRFSNTSVDVDKDVIKPILDEDLIGVDDILEEITTSIITPMRLNIPGIPIKKGLILCGPPGTGKTSIGRWIAHQIKGKFYLVGGESNINGRCLVDAFQSCVRKANENAPAVVFIDDGDVLFEQDDVYRAFLTTLDGIENNRRADVCVILTCMNMKNIPSSLIRGGRLEMVLLTKLPTNDKIFKILKKALDKMVNVINTYDPLLSRQLSESITNDFIKEVSLKMVGWNCADIHRCVDDVTRLIVSKKNFNLVKYFDKCIRQINEQYELCAKCESTNSQEGPYYFYIS